MPPIRKIQLDKAAWLWAESEFDPKEVTEDKIDQAYRGNVPKCKLGSCRRNCRGNPYCLSGLGESKWLSENNEDSEEEDPDLQVRPPGTFVGLKNLGATCYVNSLVQLLFHNLAFRRAIFLWNPLEDPMEIEDPKCDNVITKPPHTVVGHLQFLFGLMQFGKRKSIDPLDFIKALDLEPSLQQDAQEFSKLLFSLLEESLNQQSDPKVKNLIIDYFRGEYSYITRCSKCQNDSVSPSMFYELELNVKGHKTLHESISEFLREEKLEGVNMYSCSYCNEKQEATRFINLQKLPSVLNLQLMRFIYDRQKGHKKKISSSLQFPDTLDMSPYLNIPGKEQQALYNLTAVLIHKGPSANSGHYVAHICDQTSGTWYKFNDELVEKVEGKQLKLGAEEEDEEGAKKNKQPRLAKGVLESSNAYMLVYTAQSVQKITQPITESDLRPELLQRVEESNREFERIISETKEEKKIKRAHIQEHKILMVDLLKMLPVETEGFRDWEAISAKWLTQWLAITSDKFQPVDNAALLCPHNKLDPDLVSNAKYISVNAANAIYEKYGGGPRLPACEAICRECVISKCRSIQFRVKLLEDAKDIGGLLKQKEDLESGFWIGKRSLKGWRKKALAQFEGKEGNSQTIKEVEDCPSPSSDNEATCTEAPMQPIRSLSESEPTSLSPSPDSSGDSLLPVKKKSKLTDACSELGLCFTNVESFHSMLDCIENVLIETRSKMNLTNIGITSEFYYKWKQMGLMVERICDPNLSSPSISKSTPVVSSTTNIQNFKDNSSELSVEMNGQSHHNNEHDVQPKKRKLDYQDKGEIVNGSDETKNSVRSDEEEADLEDFNEDIICQHNELIPEESLRRLVSENIWNKLKYYFPDARDFPKDAEVCSICKSMASQDQASLDLKREQATIQKEMLSSLLAGRNRPKLAHGTFKVISVPEFLRPWKKFVRENGRSPTLYSVRNSTLICVHGLLLYNPASAEDASLLYAVTDEEWNTLQNFFTVDLEITVTYGENESEVIETSPSLCEECLSARLASEKEALLQYDKAKIYIRRISNSNNKKDEVSESVSEITRSGQAMKKTTGTSKTTRAFSENQGTEAIRRSTRHRRTPGEKEIIVSSTDTVRDLKLRILNVLGVAPFDQHLSTEDGTELMDPTATLASFNIYPNSVLILKVDEPPEDTSIIMDDYIRPSEPEAGFKGTVLLKR